MPSLLEEVELLRRVPLFSGIDTSKLKLLAFTSERVTFAVGEELFHQGDTGDAAYLILRGTADVLVDSPNGEIAVANVEKNAFVGEIAILCDVPRTASVRATSELVTLRIEKDHFLRLLGEFPQISLEVLRVLADRLGKTTSELSEARARLKQA